MLSGRIVTASIKNPNVNTPMSRRKLILLPSLLVLALPGWAEARQDDAKAQARPLNLSLPRDVLQAPINHQVDEAAERNLHSPASPQDSKKSPAPANLPYGAGYEHRHREMGGAGSGVSSSPSGGGAGRRGR
jgi:hypothetical protein